MELITYSKTWNYVKLSAMSKVSTVTTLSCLLQFTLPIPCHLSSQEQDVKKAVVPANYKRFVAPFTKGSPTDVYLDLSSVDFDVTAGGDTEFSLTAVVRLQWQDHRLNLTHFAKHPYLPFPQFLEDAIWRPSLAFLDTMAIGYVSTPAPATLTKVTSDGYVVHFRRYIFAVYCVADMHRYPLDSQLCPFRITTQRETANQVRLRWLSDLQRNTSSIRMHQHSIDIGTRYLYHEEVVTSIAEILCRGLWRQLLSIFIVRLVCCDDDPVIRNRTEKEFHPHCKLGTHQVLHVAFSFPRSPFSSILTLWLPGALSVVFAWAGAWFKGAGVLLPSASLLCVGVHSIQLKTMLRGEELLTSLDIWIAICQVFIVSAFFHYAIACSAKSQMWEKKRLKETGTGSCERYYTAHGYTLMVESSTQTPVTMSVAEVDQDYYDRGARCAFGPIFGLVIACYWAYYLYFSTW
ncbi:gamma-aminobutyric acid receptor subunit pi-like isoform X2 [Ornithodoros turicata]|uniref:gamma-aminobutyric acid receptor subunit pi-like isoform X2 n=1 Tax=Ornithodoros turicata TaxID=34597 RepID=UPI003138ADFD